MCLNPRAMKVQNMRKEIENDIKILSSFYSFLALQTSLYSKLTMCLSMWKKA